MGLIIIVTILTKSVCVVAVCTGQARQQHQPTDGHHKDRLHMNCKNNDFPILFEIGQL